MLSEKSSKFIKEFRIEMMARGKREDIRNEMQDELRDHLIQSEKDGKSLESVTGGSVKNYIETLSEEIPTVNYYKRNIILLFIFLLGMFTIPRLISGEFDYTLSVFMYYLLLAVFGPLLLYNVVKYIFINHTNLEDEKIELLGYVIIISYSVLYMALLVGGLFMIRSYPVYEFFELSSQMNVVIGIILLALFIAATLYMKQWIYTFLITAISAPEIIAQIFVDGSPQDSNYIIVSSITFFVMIIVIFSVLAWWNKKEN